MVSSQNPLKETFGIVPNAAGSSTYKQKNRSDLAITPANFGRNLFFLASVRSRFY